jgi:hypothetical protein
MASLGRGAARVAAMREPAPPHAGEAPHALWRASENPTITRFDPHVRTSARPHVRATRQAPSRICGRPTLGTFLLLVSA